jgi:hypothetical protein
MPPGGLRAIKKERTRQHIRARPPGVTPAAAIRGFVLAYADGIRRIRPEVWRGELGYLAAISRPSAGWRWS